eukprot:TRINITY_DN577_c1_g1_i1.p1 TRINITY_DN577_c1_g1~~TRINITY_DN577_c1_g1_i1.p1  ORF type:complete len:457 (-),score=122.32 TRINITY_DN577_c1_g1_i1:53-1402(-)
MTADVIFHYVLIGLLSFVGVTVLWSVWSLVSFLLLSSSHRTISADVRKTKQRRAVVGGLLLAGVFGFLFFVAPHVIDSKMNRIVDTRLPELSKETKDFHDTLFVCDFHSDSLLWKERDLLKRNDYGHMDVPRLIEGNVALQAFTIVTGTPMKMNIEANDEPTLLTDMMTLKVATERWSIGSLTKRAERTLYQAARLRDLVARSEGKLFLIENQQQLKDYIARREQSKLNGEGQVQMTAGFLGIEGLSALDGNLSNIEVFYKAGIRMMALTHFYDNELGGSAHGRHKGGITLLGRKAMERMEALNILVDVAHASKATIDDVISLAKRPVVNSHTGVRGVCNNNRNLDDEQIKGIARTGGIVGIGFFSPAICGDDMIGSIVKSIRYVKDLVGIEYVGLGSDFDGFVGTPFDTTGLVYLSEALLRDGFTRDEVRLVMGENTKRLLLKALPSA